MSAGGSERWAIVGGGILGMTLAWRLVAAGRSVVLFEGAPELGGLASAWNVGDVVWDRHYHVTLLSDAHLRALWAELGLADQFRWVETRTGFFSDGKLHSMSSTLEFLRFPPLGLIDKLRLGFTIFLGSRLRNWRRLERIPVATWLRRWSGKRTFDKVWLPLLRSKLGESYERTSAAFIWATISRLYAARRTGLKKEMFGYVRGGYRTVLERFGERLTAAGVSIRLRAPVQRIAAAPGGGIEVELPGGSREMFDQAVVTVAAPLAARICTGLSSDERKRLADVEYLGIVCASLLLRKPLAGYYVTNITDSGLPFTGVIEMTALVDPAELGGHALVYLPKYVAPDDPLFEATDAAIEENFLGGLRRIYPALTRDDVLAFRVSRVRNVFALSTLGYSERLPPQRTSIPGLHIVNSAHIVNGTLNVNETIELAERTATELLAAPARPAQSAA